MITNRYAVACGLAGFMAACVVCNVTAQTVNAQTVNNVAVRSVPTCDDEIAAAQAQYQDGAFAEAIGLAAECLNRMNTSPDEAVHAYRMLALAHIKQSEFSAARAAIVNLLGVDPKYVPDAVEEPPVYVSMVSLVRRELQINRRATPLQTMAPQPLATSRVEVEVKAARPALTAAPTSEADQEEGMRRSFFERPGTWMTVGGVLIGSGVRSGEHVRGIGIGGLGVGAGGQFTGIGIGGLGVGGGEALEGLMIGGLAVGSGRRVDGIAVGGVGVGSGGHIRGVALGALGVGSGRSIRGLAIGGLGVGTGGDVTGSAFALLGIVGGHSVNGLTVAGIGTGAGEHVRGLHVAGVGLVAPRLTGILIGPIVSGQRAAGGIIAPLYARIADDGHLRGLSVSLLNHVRGHQQGVTVGLINVASTLHGVQLGVLNYAGNNPWPLRLLPGLNLHF